MPRSKRKKLGMIADQIAKEKIQLMEKIGPAGASLI
jgi:hypothetical protein